MKVDVLVHEVIVIILIINFFILFNNLPVIFGYKKGFKLGGLRVLLLSKGHPVNANKTRNSLSAHPAAREIVAARWLRNLYLFLNVIDQPLAR